VPSPLLSIVPAALEISRVLPTAEDVIIEAGLARSPVNCPACGLLSRRLHSHYPRVLRDLPWQGRPAMIRVTARRFRCLAPACSRKTFAERLGSVAPASARRTARLGDLRSWSSSSAIWLRPHRSGRAAFPHPALPGSGPHHAVRGVQGWVIRGWGRGKLRVTVSNQSQPTRRFFWLRRLRQMNQMRRTSCRNPFRERQLCGRPK